MHVRGSTVAWMALITGFAFAAGGFFMNAMWTLMPLRSWLPLAAGAAIAFALTDLLRRLLRCSAATALMLVWAVAAAYFVGLSSVAAVMLVALAALGMGSIVVPAEWPGRLPLVILVGLALIIGIDGWLLPFPLHTRAIYVIALTAIVAVRWHAISELVKTVPPYWKAAVDSAPLAALFAIGVLGVASTCAWGPTNHSDDLALHMALPSQLVQLGYYQMNAGTSAWALTAWAGDVLQAMGFMVAGVESRGAVNLLWFLTAMPLLWMLCSALQLAPWQRWASIALYASIPLTATTLCGMQSEGPSAAVTVGIAWLIAQSRGPDRRELPVVGLLMGLLLALKVSNILLVLPLGCWLLWRWRGRLPMRALPLTLGLALLVMGSSYVYAYALTGNPVLPLFNGLFRSPYFEPTNFHDGAWSKGIRWDTLWRLVFHTTDYFEGGDGNTGLVLLALAGSLLVALADPGMRPLALVACAAFYLPLSQIQYIRYAQPAMILLVPAMVGGLPRAFSRRSQQWLLASMVVLLAAAGLSLLANSTWQYRNGQLASQIKGEDGEFIATYMHEHLIAQFVKATGGKNARLLMVDNREPYAAEFAGSAYTINWYDPELRQLASLAYLDPSGDAWLSLLDKTGVDLVMVRNEMVNRALLQGLQRDNAERIYTVDDLQLWRLHPASVRADVTRAADAYLVKFDTSLAPRKASLVNADLQFKCDRVDKPIVITWEVGTKDTPAWHYSHWAKCMPGGVASATLSLAVPRPISTFNVSASAPADMSVELTGQHAVFRNDLSVERDLASAFRNRLARRIMPNEKLASGIPGKAAQAPPQAVIVSFDPAQIPPGAGMVSARLELQCTQQNSPIVIGWKLTGARGRHKEQYQHALCEQDGRAHAALETRLPTKLSSFTVTAIPADSVDMNLGLVRADADYSVNYRTAPNVIASARFLLGGWIEGDPEIKRLSP